MLNYEHSKQILSGLLGPHFLRSPNTKLPLKDQNGNYKYGTTVINFPRPKYGSSKVVEFLVSDAVSEPKYPYRCDPVKFSNLLMPQKENGQKYLIEWDDFSFLCTAYMDLAQLNKDKRDDDNSIKTYYLGNPTIMEKPDISVNYDCPINMSNVRIVDFDENVPFFIKIDGQKQELTIFHNDIEIKAMTIGIYMQPDPEIYLGLGINSIDPDSDTFLDSEASNFIEPGRTVLVGDTERYYKWPEYQRIRLNTNSRFDKELPLLDQAKLIALDESAPKNLTPTIENQDMILFPEAEGDETVDEDKRIGWGRINYFGLFYGQKDDDTQQHPFLWGKITDNDGNVGVDIGYHEVPVIRKSGLRISLE